MKFFKHRLWKNKNFNLLWVGSTMSLMGTEISNLAIPTVALTLLGGGAMEVGILKASEMIAFPVLGLFAGIMADRLNPRHIMIVSDLARFILLALIPISYFFDILNIYVLIVVAMIMSIFSVFSNVSYSTYITRIVEPDDLVEGNSRLNASQSFAQILGPTLAGWLILIFGTIQSVVVDVFSYLISAVTLLFSKDTKKAFYTAPAKEEKKENSLFKDIKEGLVLVFSNKVIRTITLATAFANLGHSIVQPMILVFAYNSLGLSTEHMGIILSLGSVGVLFGAMCSTKFSERLGLGKTLFLSMFCVGIGGFILIGASFGIPSIMLTLGWFIISFFDAVYNINQFTLRQLNTPMEFQGRMNATVRIAIMGIIPIGSTFGGFIGSSFGTVTALVMGAASYFMVPLIVYLTHLIRIENAASTVKEEEKVAVNE